MHTSHCTSGTVSLGGVADGASGCLLDLRSTWPLAVLAPRTGAMLGMDGEKRGDASKRAV